MAPYTLTSPYFSTSTDVNACGGSGKERTVQVVVVGAGIGGLTAALGLRQSGCAVHVYEQGSVLREVGARLAINPNATQVLHHLGLADALAAVGVRSLSLDSRDWRTGALLGRVPLGEEAIANWGAPFYHLHRADLHDTQRAALGEGSITLGARCIAVTQDATTVTARFADEREVSGDLLFGADGIYSVVRGSVALLGDAAHPMLPYMAQGAAQSIEDALVLARCVADDGGGLPGTLETYAARRQERSAAVQAASREAGRLVRLTDPAEVEARNAQLSASPEALVARFDWTWRYDVS
jgi:2-polyprenyl-6-methoxyphenol hydroxylase-like FAD-dependent oxidoreductase